MREHLDEQRDGADDRGDDEGGPPAPDLADIGADGRRANRGDRNAGQDDGHGARHQRASAPDAWPWPPPSTRSRRGLRRAARAPAATWSDLTPSAAKMFDSTSNAVSAHITILRSSRLVMIAIVGAAIAPTIGGCRHRLAGRALGYAEIGGQRRQQARRQELGGHQAEDAERKRDDRGPGWGDFIALCSGLANGVVGVGWRIRSWRVSIRVAAHMGVTAWSFHARNATMLDRSSKPVPADSDPLSEMLRGLRLDGVDYGRCEMAAPWGIVFPAAACRAVPFHRPAKMLAADARQGMDRSSIRRCRAAAARRRARAFERRRMSPPSRLSGYAIEEVSEQYLRCPRRRRWARQRCCFAAACASIWTACIRCWG